MGNHRRAWTVRLGAGLASLGALSGGGCATDWGVRRGPVFEEFGEGLLAIGAAVGAGIGLSALAEAGGGENTEYLFRPEYEWGDRGW